MMKSNKCHVFIIVISLSFFLQACTPMYIKTNPGDLTEMKHSQLLVADEQSLCYGYKETKSEMLKNVIIERKLMSESDWKMLDSKFVDGGISECALHMSALVCQNTKTQVQNDTQKVAKLWYCTLDDKWARWGFGRVKKYDVVTVDNKLVKIKVRGFLQELPNYIFQGLMLTP